MKQSFLLVLFSFFLAACGSAVPVSELEAAARRVEAGSAVLIDVREPAEWAATGVSAPAVLLSKGSLDAGSAEWKAFLSANKDKELLLICRSGNRSGQVARRLASEGYRTTNLGAFSAWKAAGLPVRSVP